ncbi:MAG: DUF5947 family protein [Chloroflexota bacterium]|jgi:hypothetical protein
MTERGVGGLRRFVQPPTTPGSPDLRRFLTPRQRPAPGERCEFCTEELPDRHSHVVNVETRSLMCACRSCYFLFAPEGAAAGKYRAVPERWLRDPEFRLADETWDTLQIPVGIAFFFRNSTMDQTVAFYPSPAGATESLLPLDAWAAVERTNPVLAELVPDVEALLVYRPRGRPMRCFLVPIDACYELVGIIRRHWKGFDGGDEAWGRIDAFFDEVQARSRPVASAVRA